jgi:ankyrin repeat protein
MLSAALKMANVVVYGDLINAIEANDLKRVTELLAMGEDPNVLPPNHNYVPLQIALLYSRLDCAIELLKHKANPNILTPQWESGTLLHFAAKTNRIAFIRLLLFAGANPATKNQFNQEVTHSRISTPKIRLMITDLSQKINALKIVIQEGNNCLFKENYTDAILRFQQAAGIYEQQALEEKSGAYDALYENKERPDNTGLIRYFNERALLGLPQK